MRSRQPCGLFSAMLVAIFVAPGWAQDWAKLEKQVGSHDDGERSAAVRAAAEAGGSRAIDLILQALNDEQAYVRDLASEKLVELVDRHAMEQQVAPRFSKLPDRARLAAGFLLSRWRVPVPWAPIFDVLKDRDARLREAWLSGLVAIARAATAAPDEPRPKGRSQREWDGVLATRMAARESFEALDPKAFSKALLPLYREKDRFVRASAVELATLGPEPARSEARAKCARDEDAAVRAAVLLGAIRAEPNTATARLRDALQDRAWQVRAIAARAWQELPFEFDALALLIAALEQEDEASAARRPLVAALEVQSQMKFGDRPAEWQRWHADLDPQWRPAERRERTEAEITPPTTVAWHGLPVDLRRVVFVIDNSGSMRDPLPSEEGVAPRTKRSLIEAELARVVHALPAEVEANVLLFADGVESWRERLLPLKAKDREALLSWVAARPPRGATNLLAGVLTALEDPAVEAIYVLSDGAPSAGEQIFRELVIERIRERNRFAAVRIHTAAVLAPAADDAARRRVEQHRKFLTEMATQTGGRAVEVQ